MNYLKELNAFYQQIIFNPLSGSAVALWNTLMHFNNLSGWQKTFSVPVSIIELKSGIKGSSFKRARDELQEKGYIRVTSRSGRQAAVYQMISQIKPMCQVNSFMDVETDAKQDTIPASETQWQTQPSQAEQSAHFTHDSLEQPVNEPIENQAAHQMNEDNMNHNTNQRAAHTTKDSLVHNVKDNMDHNTDHSTTNSTKVSAHHNKNHYTADNMVHYAEDNVDHNTDHNADPLVKQYINKNKIKHKTKQTTTTTDAIRFYQDYFGMASSYTADDICHWINDIGEPLVLEAMQRALDQQKPRWQYVKGILKAWSKKGITTVEQVAANEAAFRNRQLQQQHQRPSTAGSEVIPGWFQKRKQKQERNRQQKQQQTATSHAVGSPEWEECERLLVKYSKKHTNSKVLV
ncbi:DnaD domain-containing protein [Lentibacillus cibarius]|uniref:DnaD domain protein n=1 Tax=Lentibacillus cibarius TaxID=2583219 RepID=A0A5S3QMV9_9BACI|nr:DnaD domain protein [Lentibacillus cibarius]TMN23292.1 DnaD domain protein [Lentibacillus cibarius]